METKGLVSTMCLVADAVIVYQRSPPQGLRTHSCGYALAVHINYLVYDARRNDAAGRNERKRRLKANANVRARSPMSIENFTGSWAGQ